MIRLRWATVYACLGLACSSGDTAPGSGTGTNTTTGSGPTTFATFSTTAPPVTTDPGDGSTGGSDSSSGAASQTETDTDADASSSSTGSGLCPGSTHACMEDAPDGWSGPVAVHQAAFDPRLRNPEPPPCGAAYPDPATTGFEDLLAEPATCECACGDANGAACDNSTTLRFWGDDATCGEGTAQAVTIFALSCNTLLAEFSGNGNYSADPLVAVGGACAPSTEETLEPALWSWQSQACEGATTIRDAGCAEDRVCAPLPESRDAAMCIWQAGEHECPDTFGTARTLYEGIEDGRGCEICSCGSPNGLCDSATISLSGSPTCVFPPAGVVGVDGECDNSGNGNTVSAASLNGGSPTAFCVPSEPESAGAAVGTEPVTVCCVDR